MNIFTYTNFRELSTDTNMAFASGEDGSITSWQRFVYRGYLQIAAFDVNSVIIDEEEHQGHALATTTFWDPMEPTATRPLAITDHSGNTSTTYFHTHDLTKNVCELLDSTGTIITSYDYTPFGAVSTSNSATPNTFTFSSEVLDQETGLVYYNYRYYSPELGRWLKPDPIGEKGGWNLYAMVKNNVNNFIDKDGLADIRIPMNGLTPPSGEPSPEFKNSLYKIVSAMKNKKCPESFDCQTVCSELYNSFSSSAFVNCVASCERGLGFPPVPVKKGIWEKVKDFFVNLFN